MTLSVVYLLKLPAKDPKWLVVGNAIKVLSPTYYERFKKWQQESRLAWFEDVAQNNELPLHAASGWGYMSELQYNEMVHHVLQEMPIKSKDSVFEMGCGVGAVLKLIRLIYGEKISVGGSDLSPQAIAKIREIFPKETSNFYVSTMTEKNDNISDNSKDHVISFGAMAMYLYIEQMLTAIKEALRISKPGGHLCFTHFVEPNGVLKGSILQPVEKSFWSKLAKNFNLEYKLENLIVKQMMHQKDRYFVCFSKGLKASQAL
jgi:ubiquinone/menaquinone biosynthesis C-methylase UbiE